MKQSLAQNNSKIASVVPLVAVYCIHTKETRCLMCNNVNFVPNT